MDVWDQGTSRSSVWESPAPWFINGCLLSVSSHGGRDTNPIMRAWLLLPNCPQRALLLICTIELGFRIQHKNLMGDGGGIENTNIQSIRQDKWVHEIIHALASAFLFNLISCPSVQQNSTGHCSLTRASWNIPCAPPLHTLLPLPRLFFLPYLLLLSHFHILFKSPSSTGKSKLPIFWCNIGSA